MMGPTYRWVSLWRSRPLWSTNRGKDRLHWGCPNPRQVGTPVMEEMMFQKISMETTTSEAMGMLPTTSCTRDVGECFFCHKLKDLLRRQYDFGMFVVEYHNEHWSFPRYEAF